MGVDPKAFEEIFDTVEQVNHCIIARSDAAGCLWYPEMVRPRSRRMSGETYRKENIHASEDGPSWLERNLVGADW